MQSTTTSKPPIPDSLRKKLTRAILSHVKARGLAKGSYARADLLLDSIVKILRPGDEFELPNGKVAVVKDNFAGKNKVFRSHGIHRYELELRDKEDDLLF